MSKRELLVDFAVGAAALVVYFITLAPTITWLNEGADSGDLVTAAYTLGIPHPTGYPLYTIVAAGLAHLPFGEPARNVNVLSALASAGAIVLTAMAGRALLPNTTRISRWIPASLALAFAFTPGLWSQATIAEVNGLAVFIAAALFAVLFSDSPHRFFLAALILGVGLTHHLTILLLAPSAILLLASTRWTRSELVRAALFLIAPLALYIYLPVSASTHPPIDWGDPAHLEGFLWVISGAPYRSYLLGISASEILTRLAITAHLLLNQVTVVGVALGVWGALQMGKSARLQTRRQFVALVVAFALVVAYAVAYASRDSFVYLVLAYLVFVMWMMYGANDVVHKLLSDDLIATPRRAVLGAGIALLLALFPLYNFFANFNAMNVSSDYTAYDYAKTIFTEIPRQAVVVTEGDEHFFALEYYRYVVARNASEIVVVSSELLQFPWYVEQVQRPLPGLNATSAIPTDRLGAVVDAAIVQGRSVYATAHGDWFSQYLVERHGDYYRVVGRLQ